MGIDIGAEFNAIACMNKEGTALGRHPRMYKDLHGCDGGRAVRLRRYPVACTIQLAASTPLT